MPHPNPTGAGVVPLFQGRGQRSRGIRDSPPFRLRQLVAKTRRPPPTAFLHAGSSAGKDGFATKSTSRNPPGNGVREEGKVCY